MTSRSEFRLILRQDNAEARLCDYGHTAGLISDERYAEYRERRRVIDEEVARLRRTTVAPSEKVNSILVGAGSTEITTGVKEADLIKRPQIEYAMLAEVDPDRPALSHGASLAVQTEIKYEGYIKRQLDDARKQEKLENKLIPADIDYEKIAGLRIEAVQKLSKLRPVSIGQASRISGVSPADMSVLIIYLTVKRPRELKDNSEN